MRELSFLVNNLLCTLQIAGTSIVLFMRASDQQCKEMSVFMDALCIRYPSLHFLKVNRKQNFLRSVYEQVNLM